MVVAKYNVPFPPPSPAKLLFCGGAVGAHSLSAPLVCPDRQLRNDWRGIQAGTSCPAAANAGSSCGRFKSTPDVKVSGGAGGMMIGWGGGGGQSVLKLLTAHTALQWCIQRTSWLNLRVLWLLVFSPQKFLRCSSNCKVYICGCLLLAIVINRIEQAGRKNWEAN